MSTRFNVLRCKFDGRDLKIHLIILRSRCRSWECCWII